MPKTINTKIRKDGYIRVRLTHTLHGQILSLAKRRGTTLSELVRELLQAEINKPK